MQDEPDRAGGEAGAGGRGRRGRRRDLKVAGRRIPVPRSRVARIALGIAFIIGGIFAILPVLGLWMIPLGLIILSYDIPAARRIVVAGQRALTQWWRRWRDRWRNGRSPGGRS